MGCWRVGKERGNSRTIAIGMVRRMKVIGIIEPLNRRRAEVADAGSAVIDRGREKDERTLVKRIVFKSNQRLQPENLEVTDCFLFGE